MSGKGERVPAFDTAALAAQVARRVRHRGLSYRRAAEEIGIAPSSLTWLIGNQRRPDVDTLAKMLAWLHGEQTPLLSLTLPGTLAAQRARIIGRPR